MVRASGSVVAFNEIVTPSRDPVTVFPEAVFQFATSVAPGANALNVWVVDEATTIEKSKREVAERRRFMPAPYESFSITRKIECICDSVSSSDT